jgi:hypothetical protein
MQQQRRRFWVGLAVVNQTGEEWQTVAGRPQGEQAEEELVG